ncbi:putative subunit C of exonuclease SbcCD [Paenibacillus sp. 32O-W]|uniref:TIGR02680 family protein n=1 Tax=Paenibacillus sp. 32O-W TaxID=1695218 RepID=UPI00071EA052|nr:TIGR02680 family protein [Paenibacillus sp. 32O-W]ALS26939.1 putative subunit C of exonuclease SbcCD [Paenibacillus sp. 32O-W]
MEQTTVGTTERTAELGTAVAGTASMRRADGAQPPDRWQMNRVGILNFWYYDEEEFQLEDGRLILRGANGSGKSVTMQSFLPLVLDGDKRPHRLDPFGSRDRRIEYYLLGEDDDGKGKTDATGYLWMEFRHGRTGAFKTIGIGLRARRNASQVQFWGFVLEDGRRIGRDFWLYDRNRWLEDQVRIPLDRKELEGKIGSGGMVVQDQKSYQDLVNKQIFGFADIEAFQDLLQLMIQLRSPKLSKDFKPSAIYEILHQALPPLMEEELRPLSEVLEDMDQMADRLDEIRRHRGEMVRLQERYDFYNKHILYTKAGELLENHASYKEVAARVKASETALEQAEREKEAAAAERADIQRRLQDIALERELLEKHEAIGKQREYEAAAKALEDTERQLERSRDKAQKARIRQDRLQREQEEAASSRDASERIQRETLDEMEQMAGEMEFAEHAVYHRYWTPNVPEDDAWKDAWRRDIRRHRERVELALVKAAEEREAASMVKEREIELGEASRVRDEAERERAEREKRLEEAKERLKDAIVVWRDGLKELEFGDEAIRETFGAIRNYGPEQPSLELVRAPLLQRYAVGRDALVERRLGFERRRDELLEQKRRLEEEKRSWEESREPEPPRSEARENFRRGKARVGAPLYALCDFRKQVGEEERARIEEALERAGLLDAWISPDGWLEDCGSGDEEAWIVPKPIEFGYTLADLLVADPPEESGVTAEMVDAVLRSFLWDEGSALQDGADWHGIIAADGSYRLGPLAGRSRVKVRAEYIGRETRKRTRMFEIARLAEAIAAVEAELHEVQLSIDGQREAESRLAEERDRFPDGTELTDGLRALQEAGYRLEAALRHEERALERFKAKSEEWRELQRQLHEMTAGWSRLKREKELAEAASVIREYEGALSELHSLWRQYRDASAAWERLRDELETTALELEDEEAQMDELDERRRDQRAQTETLRKLIEELGLADVARRLEEIRAEQTALVQRNREQERLLDAAKDKAARAEAQLALLSEQAEGRKLGLDRATVQLWTELRRGLVPEWREELREEWPGDERNDAEPFAVQPPEGDAACQLAREIRRRYEPLFAGRNAENITNRLLEQFTAARMMLTEYVLQTTDDETTGRILVHSMRDPHRPLPPQTLLDELAEQEAEQSALLSEKDRELYEEIILRSVGKAIRQRIHRAEQWVREMNKLMEERDTSSGLRLRLEWEPKPASGEQQLDVYDLVEMLKRDSHRLREDEIDAMIEHFRAQIAGAKQSAEEEQESLRQHLYRALDYRNWFYFELKYKKGEQTGYRPLTDARFNVLSGGEKAMAMYIPLFAATWSRYSDARSDAPRLISLDEAFAGVDEENMRDMFKLLTDMGFDYMMTSQVLWGCFDTVPKLAIYEIYRPKDVDFVTLFRYRWNGKRREYVENVRTE